MKISLNGKWQMDYISAEPYTAEAEPSFVKSGGYTVECAVPGYWEDMLDEFRRSDLHTRLHYNPLYTLQRYPQAGYVPDMALPNVVGCFVYQRSISLDAAPTDAELCFGGVQNRLSAWVNGKYIGTHEGYSSSFSLKIEDGILTVTMPKTEPKQKVTKAIEVS